jgi:hypothetical protein
MDIRILNNIPSIAGQASEATLIITRVTGTDLSTGIDSMRLFKDPALREKKNQPMWLTAANSTQIEGSVHTSKDYRFNNIDWLSA